MNKKFCILFSIIIISSACSNLTPQAINEPKSTETSQPTLTSTPTSIPRPTSTPTLIPIQPEVFEAYKMQVENATSPIMDIDLIQHVMIAGSIGDGPGGFSYPEQEILAIKNAIGIVKKIVEDINKISPPSELTNAHEDLIQGFSRLLAGLTDISEHQKNIDFDQYSRGKESILEFRDYYNSWSLELFSYSPDKYLSKNIPGMDIDSSLQREQDNMRMLYVPSGYFQYTIPGASDNKTFSYPVYLDPYWIDETEITNKMFALFVDATGYVTDVEKEGNSNVVIKSETDWNVIGADWQHPLGPESSINVLDNHPVTQISWNDAAAYCEWAGARLPTEAEWEKAALWDEVKLYQKSYPWGNTFNCSNGNYHDQTIECDLYENTAPVGSYINGASSFGVLDMSGNVREWVSDWYIEKEFYNFPGYYDHSLFINPQGPITGENKVYRGDYWFTNSFGTSFSTRGNRSPADTDNLRGFRCAQSVTK